MSLYGKKSAKASIHVGKYAGKEYFCDIDFELLFCVMAKVIKTKKGLALNLKGKPLQEMLSTPAQSPLYAVVPDDYQGIIPKVTARPGDKVRAGSALMYHKSYPEMLFTSPVSGEVVAVNRGAKRKVLSIEVRPDGLNEYEAFAVGDPASLSAEQIKQLLLSSGMWGFIRQRPYDIVALPDVTPRDIFVTANFTAPLAPDFGFIVQGEERALQTALNALTKLTTGKVYVGVQPGSKLDLKNVELYEVQGPHPAGNVGVLINHTVPVNRGETVWTLKATDLIVMGKFLLTGKVDFSRMIAMTGSDAAAHGYVRVMPGSNVFSIFNPLTIKHDHESVIDGNVFIGKKLTEAESYLSAQCDQITVIPEGDDVDELFGWATPRLNQFSMSRAYFSWLQGKNKEYVLDARVKGGERAMIMSNEYDRVFPMDIFPEYLLKAIISFDIDKMEDLGIYEVAPEDFAVCEFVDTSKIELQRIVREGLDMLYKEMN